MVTAIIIEIQPILASVSVFLSDPQSFQLLLVKYYYCMNNMVNAFIKPAGCCMGILYYCMGSYMSNSWMNGHCTLVIPSFNIIFFEPCFHNNCVNDIGVGFGRKIGRSLFSFLTLFSFQLSFWTVRGHGVFPPGFPAFKF